MNKIVVAAAAACLLLVGCSGGEKQPPYRTDLEIKEVMGHVIDFGAQAFWHSAGFVDTKEGTVSLTPSTEEGWLTAVSGAATIAEGANALMLPDRARDDGDWMKFAGQLSDAAREAMASADAGEAAWLDLQKAKASGASPVAAQAALTTAEGQMFDNGGKIYEVCTACHAQYLLPFVDAEGETHMPVLKKK